MSVARMDAAACVDAIKSSGRTIFDVSPPGSPLYLASTELEAWLDEKLRGFSVAGLPLRTRSKVVKQRICEVLATWCRLRLNERSRWRDFPARISTPMCRLPEGFL